MPSKGFLVPNCHSEYVFLPLLLAWGTPPPYSLAFFPMTVQHPCWPVPCGPLREFCVCSAQWDDAGRLGECCTGRNFQDIGFNFVIWNGRKWDPEGKGYFKSMPWFRIQACCFPTNVFFIFHVHSSKLNIKTCFKALLLSILARLFQHQLIYSYKVLNIPAKGIPVPRMCSRLHSEPIPLIPLGLIINSLIILTFIVLFFLRHKWTQALNCFIILDTKSLISEVLKACPFPTSGSICSRHAWGPFIPSSFISQLYFQQHLIKISGADSRRDALCVWHHFLLTVIQYARQYHAHFPSEKNWGWKR